MDISLPIFSFFIWPLVVKVVSVARIIEIFCITRYQLKDLDILFPLVINYEMLIYLKSIHFGDAQSLVMAQGCKYEKRSEMSISLEVPAQAD